MQPYPHSYLAAASGDPASLAAVTSPELPQIQTAAAPQFDGPGGYWSPETLLCAAIADCFVLTFRAVSRAARLPWLHLECRVEGTLERADRTARFTRFATFATLTVPPEADPQVASKLLDRAEQGCLVANSLLGTRSLESRVVTQSGAEDLR